MYFELIQGGSGGESGGKMVQNKDAALGASVVLSLISLVLLFGVTWYFQSSLDLLQQQVEFDREQLLKLQEQVKVSCTLVFQCLCVSGAKQQFRYLHSDS